MHCAEMGPGHLLLHTTLLPSRYQTEALYAAGTDNKRPAINLQELAESDRCKPSGRAVHVEHACLRGGWNATLGGPARPADDKEGYHVRHRDELVRSKTRVLGDNAAEEASLHKLRNDKVDRKGGNT